MTSLMRATRGRHDPAEWDELRDVREGRRHHRKFRARFGERRVQAFQVGEGSIELSSRLDDVVHSGAHGDQIGPHRQRHAELAR